MGVLTVASIASAQDKGSPAAGCFERLHSPSTPRDADFAFDIRFDRTLGGESYSCDVVMRASAVRNVLEDFRFGIVYESAPHLTRSVQFPLSAAARSTRDVNEQPKGILIRNVAELLEFRRAHFDRLHVALVSCANVQNVSIVLSRSYGVMIGSGQFWIQQNQGMVTPRIVSIQLFPMTTAMLAAYCLGDRS